MALDLPHRARLNDLWASAAERLSKEDRQSINFSRDDRLGVVSEVLGLAEKAKADCIKHRWQWRREGKAPIILTDLLDKVVHWVDLFKQVGDAAVQYDPVHAALPWAGVRFLLQIAVNESNKFNFVIESAAAIAEIISHYAVIEKVYIQPTSSGAGTTSDARKELERSLIQLYARVLIYLSKVNKYFRESSPKRWIKSGLLGQSDLESSLSQIDGAQKIVDRCRALANVRYDMDRDEETRRILEEIYRPVNRAKRTKILLWLSPEPYIEHHTQTMRDMVPGTGVWLLVDPVFESWKKNSTSSILWLHGIPGSGKSKLVSLVIEDAKRSFEAGLSPPPVFFYCSRNAAEPGRGDPARIIASIVRQLSSLEPGSAILSPTRTLYSTREAEGFASGPLGIEESQEIILQLVEHYPVTTIVIDALDECDPETRGGLIDLLHNIRERSSNLVKIFVSSRDDSDIVQEFEKHPDLKISSGRNKGDIESFVQIETERLITKRRLLRFSSRKDELKQTIVHKMTEGAGGMFRWVSLQLQMLCELTTDEAILERVGRLPPKLEDLYREIYDQITSTAEADFRIARHIFAWLLCAQRPFTADEFQTVVSIRPGGGLSRPSREQILAICRNFVILDDSLDTFRFAHLSVQEFLEIQQEYHITTAHSLVSESCLSQLIGNSNNLKAETFLSRYMEPGLRCHSSNDWFRIYADVYWAMHCQHASTHRTEGTLKALFLFFLSNETCPTSPFARWARDIARSLDAESCRLGEHSLNLVWYNIEKKISSTRFKLSGQEAKVPFSRITFLACSFDFREIVADRIASGAFHVNYTNLEGDTALDTTVKHGSFAVLSEILADKSISVTESALIAAVRNGDKGTDALSHLLRQRGNQIIITEALTKAAAETSLEAMSIVLAQGDKAEITEEVLKAAVGNTIFGENIISLLLRERPDQVIFTEGVFNAAAGNRGGSGVMRLLLDQKGKNITITEAIILTAIKTGSAGEEILSLLFDRGLEMAVSDKVLNAEAKKLFSRDDFMWQLLHRLRPDTYIPPSTIANIFMRYGCNVAELVLSQQGPDFEITSEILVSAARNSDTVVVKHLLKSQRKRAEMTEDALRIIIQYCDGETLGLLLDQLGDEIRITDGIVKAAAMNFRSSLSVMSVLIDWRRTAINVTEDLILSAGTMCSRGERWNGTITLILGRLKDEINMTNEIVMAVAKVGDISAFSQLLDKWNEKVVVTEELLIAVVHNEYHPKDIMSLLMDRRGEEIVITDKFVKELASISTPYKRESKLLEMLLDQRGSEVKITKGVVEAAIKNRKGGVRIMNALLDRRGGEIKITDNMIRLAAAISQEGHLILSLLLKRCREQITITNEVIMAATANKFYHGSSRNYPLMQLLRDKRGEEIHVTEEVVKAAVSNKDRGREMLTILIYKRGEEVKVTEEIITIAAGNSVSGMGIMPVLLGHLRRQGIQAMIPREAVKAAAENRNSYDGEKIARILLAHADNGCRRYIMELFPRLGEGV